MGQGCLLASIISLALAAPAFAGGYANDQRASSSEAASRPKAKPRVVRVEDPRIPEANLLMFDLLNAPDACSRLPEARVETPPSASR